jgi:hypothetical protein
MNLKYIYSLLTSLLMLTAFSACSPDDYDLASADVKSADLVEGVAFHVTHDSQNPNLIHCTVDDKYANYAVAWETPQGRSTSRSVDLKIAFPGTYDVKLGVSTRGGYVWSDAYQFTVDDMCSEFISDELWTMLTNGGGESKTWVLDLDATGKSVKFGGPIWYFTSNYTWDMLHNAAGENYIDGDPWDASSAIDASNAGVWYWSAEFSGNEWMTRDGDDDPNNGMYDFGTMTFDLIGGANMTVDQTSYGKDGYGVTKGVFNMDTDTHVLTVSGVYPLHPTTYDSQVKACKTYQILYLTKDFLQLMDDNGTCYNYVEKEYYDNFTAEVESASLPEGWYGQFVSQNLFGSWAMDESEAYDYFDLNGNRTYTGNATLASDLADITLKFNTPDVDLYAATNLAGDTFKGNYLANEDGTLYFDNGVGTSTIADGVEFRTANDNSLKVLDVTFDDLGRISDIWLGRPMYDYAGVTIQYIGYHFTAGLGGSTGPTFKTALYCADSAWTWYNSDTVYISGDGTYTFTSNTNGFDAYVIYIDALKLLGTYPNCDMEVVDMKVDGNSINMTDSDVIRCAGDDPTTCRRFILNPWNDASAAFTPLFTGAQTLSVTLKVTFDTGSPFPVD